MTTARKFTLIAHVTFSIGWFGLAAAVLVLAIAGLISDDVGVVDAAYGGTTLIWRFAIIPFALAAMTTGLIQALSTPWGLVRHYWVVVKFLLTFGAVVLLLLHTESLLPTLSAAAIDSSRGHVAAHSGIPPRIHLIVAASGTLLLLLVTTTLSIFKPWGKTAYGQRKEAM